MKSPRTAIDIGPDQIEQLNAIAGAVGALSRSGPTHGSPSWRVLVKDIAAGKIKVYNPKATREEREPRKAKAKKKSKRPRTPGAPDWWAPWYGNAMGIDVAMTRSGLNRPALLALGLTFGINPFLKTPDIVIGRPEWPADFVPSRPHWWWEPADDGTMFAEDAVAASGLTVEQLVAAGLVLVDDDNFLAAPPAWAGWAAIEKHSRQTQ